MIWRVGTDCSGIEAPIQALKQLKIDIEHIFSSDIDKYARKSIIANYEPKILYEDMLVDRKLDDIDLYICGFPCQPFSHAGHRKGTDDKRGKIFWECLKVINEKKPKIFILENVRGLLSIEKGETFKEILKCLEELKDYKIQWKLLNTRDYGIPQNRERLYIIGISNDYYNKKLKGNFEWPQKIKLKSLKNYIDKQDNNKQEIPKSYLDMFSKIPKDSQFINISFKDHTYPNSNKFAPCIMASNKLWCVPKHRYANIKENLSLQGFPIDFKQDVSNYQFKKQIGNSMSVNVLKKLFNSLKIRSNTRKKVKSNTM